MRSTSAKIFFAGLFCLTFFITKLSAQIAANPTQGCAPLVGVQFSGLPGATGIQWNFGDGTFANINNPVHTFLQPGNYNVGYTATVGGAPVNQTILIKVFGKPTPAFTLNPPVNGCIPLTVSATDQSTGSGGAAITTWTWNFGDGGSSTQQNPNYVYTLGGQFDITLIVKDANGCDSSITLQDAVTVSPKPTVIISSNPSNLNSCTTPFSVTFNGTSSQTNSPIGGGLTYQWDFGNSTTSSVVSPPAVTYTNQGTYTVTLTCTDNNNCSQVSTKTVTVLQPQVKAVVPDTICLGTTISIRDTSVASQTVWNWGDGSPNNTVFVPNNAIHTYAAAGTYTITATSSINSCNDIETFVIVVDEAVADFTTAAPHFSCNPTSTITYTNLSTGAVSYDWSFSNGDSSILVNPTTTFSQNSLNPYTIYQDQLLSATLVVTSAFGCVDSITKALDTLHRPTAFFYTNGNEGCAPLTITFTDSSFSTSAITSYEWHFGDGTPNISGPTDTIVTHTYTNTGLFESYLVIHNANGCTDTSFIYPINSVNPPNPSFTFAPSVVCPNDSVVITNNTNPADSVNHWHVISDDTYFSGCISDPNPAWAFNHVGVHDITLVAYTHSCRNDTTVPLQVTVKGPIVSGRYHTQCGDSAYKVMFEAYLQDTETATWDYGDGTTEVLTGSGHFTTYHTYTASGDYAASLTGTNSLTGCNPFVDTMTVKVRKIHAAFTNTGTICSGLATSYNASASVDVMASCGIGYTWLFVDTASGAPVGIPPFVSQNPVLSQPLPPGNYIIKLVVKDANECRDTTEGYIRVSGVNAAFTVNSTTGCLPSFTLNTTQNSTSDTTITTYAWNFGDGSPSVNTASPSHTYTAATSPSQNYTVSLSATNALGCVSSTSQVITISAPIPTLTATTAPFICANKTVSFSSAGVAGASNYAWNFGDGSSIQNTATGTTTHTFTSGGTYSVSVSVSDPSGCQGLSNITVVSVQDYPLAGFEYINQCDPTKQNACAGCAIVFNDTSINAFPGPRQWNLGTGGPIVGSPSVSTTYLTPGIYPIKLIVSSTYGCRDTIVDSITVYGADADLTLDKTTICKGEAINFNIIDSSNVYTWHWDFGDGTEDVAVAPVNHVYNYHPPGGTTNVALIYWTQDSTCRYSAVQPVNIRQVIADFDRNNEVAVPDSMHCLGSQDLFTNTSQNANTYNWDFGDGNTSTAISPNHTYAAAGQYTVTLTISDSQFGCKDTIHKYMEIFPSPNATASGKDTCAGQPVFLQVSGDPGLTYIWNPGTVLNDSTIANPVATITQTTTFTVTAYSAQGCSTIVNTLVYIQQPPYSITWDTTIIIGQTAPIPGYAGPGMIYSWDPTTDLSCSNCSNPVSSSLTNIVYTASVSDTMGCFNTTNTFSIEVTPESTVDVPTAFTPDGDGVNDIIYVDGWGIKKLIYFRIYNRWGQLLFESTDLKTGWDGYYKGVLQNMETYVYQVSAETYTDAEPKNIKGYFKLIR